MCSIVRFKGFLMGEPKVSLVDQSRALQSVPRAFPLEMVVCDFSQFPVDKRHQLLKSLRISGSPLHKEFAYGLKRYVHSSSRWGIRQTLALEGCQVNPSTASQRANLPGACLVHSFLDLLPAHFR